MRRRDRLVLTLLAAGIISLFAAGSASAAVFTVNSTGDGASQALCEAGSAGCTLRGAIDAANATDAGADVIAFSPSFNGEIGDTIEIGSPLPPITSPVSIDGKACTMTAAGVGGPCVGVNAVSGASWIFDVEEEDTTIDNLAISGGVSAIVVLEASTSFSAAGNWIGVKLDGSAAGASQWGIQIGPGSDGATIGGIQPGEGNVIANNGTGLVIYGAAGTVVQGNWFGVEPDGAAATVKAGVNIEVRDLGEAKATGTEIGATISSAAQATTACDGGCNVISHASSSGIDLSFGATGPTTIHSNYVGLAPSGTTAIPNDTWSIRVAGSDAVTIGGAGGVENANFIVGSAIGIAHTSGEALEAVGNRIGVGPTGEKISRPGNGITTGGADGAKRALVAENEIYANGIGIQSAGRGAEILDNEMGGMSTGIWVLNSNGGEGGLIKGNTIREVSNAGITIENANNEVFGNTIEAVTLSAIFLKTGATGNRVGGDTAASENFIRASEQVPIALILPEASQNEVARNRGEENGGSFIGLFKANGEEPKFPNGGIVPPTLSGAYQSSATGISQPGARVRVFRKDTDQGGEIAGFLGEATADGSGNWTVPFSAQVPVGTNIAATQTNTLGGTSELAFATASAGPPPPSGPCADALVAAMCVKPPEVGPPASTLPDTTKPKVTIKKAPKAKSTSTAAKLRFVSNEAGSTFKCKLDKKAWANCKSPKTYRKLKLGKHVFKVKATDAVGNVSAVVKRKFTVQAPA
jgi:hypothetical protein